MADAKRLVFAGAGHAHLYSLARLDRFARRGIPVTVISPAAFWYSGMGPGLLSREYESGDASVDVRAMVEKGGGRFMEDRVASIHADRRYVVTTGGERVPYEALSLNVGSEVTALPVGAGNDRLYTVKPVSRLLELRQEILRFELGRVVRIMIAGGGPAGCEAAANALALCLRHGREASIRLVAGGNRLLPDLPEAAGERMADWCRRNGIIFDTGRRVSGFDGDAVLFEGGLREAADFLLLATGVHPPDLLKRSDLATDGEGALVVDGHLQAVSHPGVFGAGDCIRFEPMPLARVGVYAVRQAPVLFANLLASLLGGPMRVFRPQRRFLLILNLGDGTGLLSRGGFVTSGRMAFRIKDWLDRRFMRRFHSAPGR
ncbi:MAG: FAD-dependent oxidoreductase [Deltaproteobacteria bacterium]|nr:FAD-dependent oxidoreductase [Deltaproteobacteria bacterium]